MKQLKQDAQEGKINKEDLQRELENFKDLQDLTDILGDCRECSSASSAARTRPRSSKSCRKASDRIERLTEDEVRDLLRDQEELDEATRILMAAMAGEGEGEMEGDGLGQGRFPGRKRPIDPNDPKSKIVNQRQKAEVDPKGMQRLTGYARGGNFNKIPAKAVEGAFQQATQEAPEALDRQRIPADAADIAPSGYLQWS